MTKILIDIFKAIWPFLKESWFQGDSLHVWLNKHKVAVAWLGLLLTLSISDLFLIQELSNQRIANYNTLQRNQRLSSENGLLKKDIDILKRDLFQANVKATQLDECIQINTSTQNWINRCGFTNNFSVDSCPVPKIIIQQSARRNTDTSKRSRRNPPKSTTVIPDPPPEKKKETFRERMRRIFGKSGDRS
jgi:hypothetical protein